MVNITDLLEIAETNDERSLPLSKLREKYIQYVRENFLMTPHMVVENINTKWKNEVTSRIVKEWRQKSRTRPRIIAIQLLDTMIRSASLVKTGDDIKSTRGVESVSELENWCKIEWVLHKIRIIVKKQPNRHYAYYFGAVEA